MDELQPGHFPEPRISDKEVWVGELYGVVRSIKDEAEEKIEIGSKKYEKKYDFQFRATDKKEPLPKRGGVLDFQTMKNKKLPKHVFAPDIAADASLSELFCIGYGGFLPEGSISIEHAYSHDKIRHNQARLLDYLNKSENKEVAESFLGYEGISDYIRRDLDGKVKGSLYFFKHSYGAMTNLFLLSQAENASKSTKDLMEWIKTEDSPFLGDAFVQHVNEAGGCHEGVLFDRVYQIPDDKQDCLQIQLAEETIVILPPSGLNAKGLGQMIREWITKLEWAIELHSLNHIDLVQQFRSHVNTLIGYFLDESVNEQNRGRLIEKEQLKLEANMKELAEIQATILRQSLERSAHILYPPTTEHSSQSSPGSSDVAERNKKRKIAAHIKAGEINHYTHKMHTAIKNRYGVVLARNIYAYVSDLPYLDKLDSSDLQIISKDFSAYLDMLDQQNVSSSSHGNDKEEIQESRDLNIEEQIKVKITKLCEKALCKVEPVRAILEQKEHELRAQAQELAEIKRKLAEKERGSPVHDEQSPPSSPPARGSSVESSSKSSAFFPPAESIDSPENRKRKREEESAILPSGKRIEKNN